MVGIQIELGRKICVFGGIQNTMTQTTCSRKKRKIRRLICGQMTMKQDHGRYSTWRETKTESKVNNVCLWGSNVIVEGLMFQRKTKSDMQICG